MSWLICRRKNDGKLFIRKQIPFSAMYSTFHFKTFATAPELISRCVSERNKKNSHIYFHSGVYIVHTLVFALFYTKFFYTRFMFASSSINFILYCETGELTVSHFRSNPLQCDKCWFAIYLIVCLFVCQRAWWIEIFCAFSIQCKFNEDFPLRSVGNAQSKVIKAPN